MLCNGKYYVGCNPWLQVQVGKAEHERLRTLQKEPLVEVTPSDPTWSAWKWIDDPSCDEPANHAKETEHAEPA